MADGREKDDWKLCAFAFDLEQKRNETIREMTRNASVLLYACSVEHYVSAREGSRTYP